MITEPSPDCHEMLTEFGLINMNGRVYDPLLGRFLSTDNFVQEPNSTQSFNRYSYCLNNPLKYNDPSGEVWWIPVFANICFSGAISHANHEGFWRGALKGAAVSAASMATSYATVGIGSLCGHGLGNFGTELLRAGMHGLLNGTINCFEGKSFRAGFASGTLASMFASGAETIGAGLDGVLASSMFGGALGSGLSGGNWLEGAMTGMNVGIFNHGWKYINGEWVYELDEVVVKSFHARLASYKPMEPGLNSISPEFYMLFLGPKALLSIAKGLSSIFTKSSSQHFIRQEIKDWLNNAGTMKRSQLRSDLDAAGFKRASQYSEHYKRGDITIRLDPAGGKTPYNHMHIEVGKGRQNYDVNLNPVGRRSPDAHIRIR